MGVRREHLEGISRRVYINTQITRLFVVDHMVDLIDEHIGPEEANKIHKLYMGLILSLDEYQYSDFEPLLKDILSDIEDLPNEVKGRFKVYLDYLFPPPLPT